MILLIILEMFSFIFDYDIDISIPELSDSMKWGINNLCKNV